MNRQNKTFLPAAHRGQQIRRKRLELNLSQTTLAKFLGLSISTIGNWEKSPDIRCSESLKELQENFLGGLYDKRLRHFQARSPWQSLSSGEKNELTGLLSRIANLYSLCSLRPDLQEKMIRELLNFQPPRDFPCAQL